MKRVSVFFVFFFALSVLYGQNTGDPLPGLDSAVKELAGNINRTLAAEKVQKIAMGQFIYRNSAPVFGFYWAAQLVEELTNIPGRSFEVFGGGSAEAEWMISGEIIDMAATIRVYTRILRRGSGSVAASMHSDFQRNEFFVEMLSGGGSSSSVARDMYEPDSQSSPLAVEVGTDAAAPVINRTIHDRLDEDFFLLAPDKDGALTMETTGGLDTRMELYDAVSGDKLGENDDGGSEANAWIRQRVSAGGKYIAKVRGYDGDETGSYGFRAYLAEQVRTAPDEYENDDEFVSAKDINIGAPQQHTFTTGDDVDWVKFEITQPGSYTIRARGVNSNRLDTCMELFDSDRKSINEDDDGGENYDSRLSLRLQAGIYYLSVNCLDDEPDQPYMINITAE
jgi:hypothetical protein